MAGFLILTKNKTDWILVCTDTDPNEGNKNWTHKLYSAYLYSLQFCQRFPIVTKFCSAHPTTAEASFCYEYLRGDLLVWSPMLRVSQDLVEHN